MGFVEVDGKYYDRCGDCGEAIVERSVSTLSSVCDECWERRGWLVKNMKELYSDRFKKIQSSMAHHTGKAKQKIIAWQKELGYIKEQTK